GGGHAVGEELAANPVVVDAEADEVGVGGGFVELRAEGDAHGEEKALRGGDVVADEMVGGGEDGIERPAEFVGGEHFLQVRAGGGEGDDDFVGLVDEDVKGGAAFVAGE